jgi:ribonuclease P protein component
VESRAFTRSQRLLTSRDFQNAFDKAIIRFSTPVLLVLVTERSASADTDAPLPTEPARLGLVVSKKHLKRAVDRNRFKRVVRESFRHHQEQLKGLDIVVLARNGAIRAVHGETDAGQMEIQIILEKAWRYIQRKRG